MQFRVSKLSESKYAYALTPGDAHVVRIYSLISIFFLTNLLAGFILFVSQSWLLLMLFGPLFCIVIIYNLLEYISLSRYDGFSVQRHRRLVADFAAKGQYPRVAVMIPAAGEDVAVVEATFRAATNLHYPNYSAFLLDDSKDAIYRDMAATYRGYYFRRKQTGYHKKAGNLNALMSRIEGQDYDYILVLDADFVPDAEMLSELVPYAKPDVGIVQSPQHFGLTPEIYKRSKFEYGAALIQRDFYRITQSARNQVGGAICVGTNALYSVKALEKVKGYEGVGRQDWGHSEDVNTGLKMINTTNEFGQRYRIEYVPVRLAIGTCPDDHLSFYKQQNRWATGSMQLIFTRKTLFSKTLSPMQKICYLTNSSYYFYTIAILFSPFQLLVLLLSDRMFDWQSTLLFLPSLLLTTVVGPIVLRRHIRPVASSLVVLSNAYTFAQALYLLARRKPLGWEATGAKSAVKKRNGHFIQFKIFSSLFFAGVYLSVLAALLLNVKLQLTPSILVCILFLIAFGSHVIYLHHMFIATVNRKRLFRDIHTYAYALIFVLIVGITSLGFTLSDKYDVKLSRHTILTLVPDQNHQPLIQVGETKR